MAWYSSLYALIIVAFLYGCSTSSTISNAEFQARRHMAIADTLERSYALREATTEYMIVAEHYPSTSVHPAAVRKTAILLSAPSNPAANDSASHYWLGTYLNLSQSPEEKQIIQMYLKMVDRVKGLHDSLMWEGVVSDSLATLARKQMGEVASRGRRVQELEVELEKASSELKKLKEIDVRISKSKVKNKP